MKDKITRDTIAVFDFDGTLTYKDTLKNFLVYNFGHTAFYKGIVSKSPILLSYLLRLVHSHTAKEALFAHFFAGWDEKQFNHSCENYSLTKIDTLIRIEGRSKINWHMKQGHRLIIVSASLQNWIRPWATQNGFSDVISTEPQIENGLLTGKFRTLNCNGQEKLRRFLERYPNRDQYDLYVYGDSRGDRAIMSIADKPFLRRFY
ncbi:MAG: HAD-IB family hydrolase [Proteobacteria bacterium]|nr:HAD-IB family hydrolase [Pseudomonadota bacterium]MBU4471667.1 HAD-IB family hydrolase [Pseudomonadota bacterium]MCG2750644.1 HAD-IB family hydrolase [Desulfobacteraceae bacterium]